MLFNLKLKVNFKRPGTVTRGFAKERIFYLLRGVSCWAKFPLQTIHLHQIPQMWMLFYSFKAQAKLSNKKQ